MKWINASLPIVLLFTCTACLNAQKGGKIYGEGPLVKQELQLEEINAIGLALSGKVFVTKGDQQKVEIEAQQNIIDDLDLEVDGGEWSIDTYRDAKNYQKVTVYITVFRPESISYSWFGRHRSSRRL